MNQTVVFDMFFRKNPFNGGFSVFAGIETLLDTIVDFRFSEEDIEYLKEQEIKFFECIEKKQKPDLILPEI